MGAHHAEAGDVPVWHPVRGLFFHFGQYVAYYPWGVVGAFRRPGRVDGDVGEGGPGEGVVEVVF